MKNRLQQAAEFFQAELKHMAEHGWNVAAYIERYGTTEEPKMGDGGPLIWEADVAALFRARDRFLHTLQAEWKTKGGFAAWRKKSPLAAKLWKEERLGLTEELDLLHARQHFADAWIKCAKTSNS
jgi:hypothetical protein